MYCGVLHACTVMSCIHVPWHACIIMPYTLSCYIVHRPVCYDILFASTFHVLQCLTWMYYSVLHKCTNMSAWIYCSVLHKYTAHSFSQKEYCHTFYHTNRWFTRKSKSLPHTQVETKLCPKHTARTYQHVPHALLSTVHTFIYQTMHKNLYITESAR